jgi:PEGA domain
MVLRLSLALIAGAMLAACGSSSPPPAAPPTATAAPEEPQAQADDSAQLEILCNPPTEVMVDGKKAGKTPINGYRVAPGSHDVTFMDELTGNRTMTITLAPGEGKSVVSDRPPSAVDSAPKPKK